MKLWLHCIIGVMSYASHQQVIFHKQNKKVNLDAFFIIRVYKQIYTLCTSFGHLFICCIPQPIQISINGEKNTTQNVKLPIKHCDMARKVTGCTSCLLFRVIKKINFGLGHSCSRLMICRPILFTWTICAGQCLASAPSQAYSSPLYHEKTNDLHYSQL